MRWLAVLAAVLLGASFGSKGAEAARGEDEGRLKDTLDIEKLLTTYATTLDKRDWAAWQTVFTPDAKLDYTATFPMLRGSPKEMAEKFDWIFSILFSSTAHLISNVDITWTGPDSAKVRAMVFNPMMFRFVPAFPSFHFVGWYNHEMRRVNGQWKSINLVEEQMYNSVDNLWVCFAAFFGYRGVNYVRGSSGKKQKSL